MSNLFLEMAKLCVLFVVKTSFAEYQTKHDILKRSTRNHLSTMQKRLNLGKRQRFAAKNKANFQDDSSNRRWLQSHRGHC